MLVSRLFRQSSRGRPASVLVGIVAGVIALAATYLVDIYTPVHAVVLFGLIAVMYAAAQERRLAAIVCMLCFSVGYLFMSTEPPLTLNASAAVLSDILRFMIVSVLMFVLIDFTRKTALNSAKAQAALVNEQEESQRLERLLEGAVDAVADPMVICSAIYEGKEVRDLRVEFINEPGAASNHECGLTKQQQIGQPLTRVALGIRESGILKRHIEVFNEAKRWTGEVTTDLMGQGSRTFEIAASRVKDKIVIRWRDLTRQRQAVISLQTAERRLRSLVSATSSITWRTTRPLTFADDQPEWTRFTGQTLQEFRGSGWLDSLHPDDRAGVTSAWDEGLRDRREWTAECRLKTRQGDYRWMLMTGVPIAQEGSTDISEWVGNSVDITDRKLASAAAEGREEHLLAVLNNLFAFVGVISLDGTVISVNRAPLVAAGIAETDVVGKPFWDCHWWSHSAAAQTMLKENILSVRRGAVVRYDVPVRMTGEDLLTIDFMLSPLRDSAGNITHLIASGVDISARVQAQAALEERERRFRAISESLPVIVWTATPQGELDYISTSYSEITGVDGATRLGDLWLEQIHPLDRDGLSEAWKRSIDSKSEYRHEFRLQTKSGDYRLHYTRATLTLDALGKPFKWYGVTLDIEDLRRAETQLQSIFQSSLIGIMKFYIDGKIVDVNETFARMLGRTRDEMLRESPTWQSLTPADDLPLDNRHVEEFQRSGMVHPYEKHYLHRDGRPVPVLITAVSVGAELGSAGICYIVDMTQVRAAQEELRQITDFLEHRVKERTAELAERTEQLRSLVVELTNTETRERKRLANILHDHFQQLISAAKLKVGLIRRQLKNESLADNFSQIETLLDEAINESRSLATELSPPVLHDAGFEAGLVWLARKVERDHNLIVEIDFAPNSEPDSESIRLILFECVRELLFNVVKHAKIRAARVSVSVRDDNLLSIFVIDKGEGFNFDSKLVSASHNGSFGLFSIRERLSMLGGVLSISSDSQSGTRVEITIPVVTRKMSISPHSSSERLITSTPPVSDKRAVRVVVADDHKLFREGLISLLKQETFMTVVGEAGDGGRAVELARQLKPDILICDMSMPVMNGVQVTATLRREMPEIKVVGLSMHERDDMSKAMRDAGAVAYCTKGGPTEVLVAELKLVAEGIVHQTEA